MTTMFTTESGSTYEIDTTAKRVRRLLGAENPTPRVGADGEWRAYHDTTDLVVGHRLFIQWCSDIVPAPEPGALPLTVTTRVVSINRAGAN